MKPIIILLALTVLLFDNCFAQETPNRALTYTCTSGRLQSNYTSKLSDVNLNSMITLRILAEPVADIDTIDFFDASRAMKLAISRSDLSKLITEQNATNELDLKIDSSANIEGISHSVPFPFYMRLVYKNKQQKMSGLVGGADANKEAPNVSGNSKPSSLFNNTISNYTLANQIEDLLSQNKYDQIYSLLSTAWGVKISNKSDLISTIGTQNDFLYKIFNQIPGVVAPPKPTPTLVPKTTANAQASKTSGLSDLNIETIADGIAQFMVERFEAEIDEAAFDRLKDFLKNFPEFATLFPNTNTFLSNFDASQYSNLLMTFKEALNKDLNQMPGDIINLKTLNSTSCPIDPKTKDADKTCTDRINKLTGFLTDKVPGILLLSALEVANGSLKNEKLPDILNSIASSDFLLHQSGKQYVLPPDLANSLNLINIVSMSLRNTEIGESYISEDQINSLIANDETFNIFLGLIYQKIVYSNNQAGITIGGLNIASVFNSTNVSAIKNYLTKVSAQIKNLQTVIDNLKKDKLNAKADLTGDYTALFTTIPDVLQSLSAVNTIDPKIILPQDFDNVYKYFKEALQISNDVVIKNYNAAIMGTLTLSKDILKDYDKKNTSLDNFMTDFLKYASFASNMATAKNASDVKAAIEAVALPAGSYSIKQKSAWNISVNGYVGYGIDFNSTRLSRGLFANGIYAPIGLTISHGSNKGGSPITLFVSAFDLGSLVSYRLTNGSTDSLRQEVRLESIFSPSAQILFEIPKWPLAFGAGWRRTPELFYSNTNSFKSVPARSVFNICIMVDIPFFTLYNRPFAEANKTQ